MINIFVSGDFAPKFRIMELIDKEDYQSVFNDILPIIKESDFSITNLESPLIDEGTPIAKTGPNLKASPKSIKALKYAGFDMVTLANNHIMDYGKEGLFSTMDLCEKENIGYVGAGKNLEEAQQIKYVTLQEKIVALISVCENEWSTTQGENAGANPLNEVLLYYQIQEAKTKSDYLIVFIHGGHELYEYPSPRMKRLYRWFVDLGADAVVGHHTHCFCGYEVYNGKPIFYSLGNFVFDRNVRDSIWNFGAAVVLKLNNDSVDFDLFPYEQCNNNPGIALLTGGRKERWEQEQKEKTSIILDDKDLDAHFEDFVKRSSRLYRSYLEPSRNKYVLAAMNKGVLPRRIKGEKRLLYNNIFRCESHRDVLLTLLKTDK